MRTISRDVRIASISLVVGIVVGFLVSSHFYQLARRQVRKDARQELLNGLLVDLEHNTLGKNFPHLNDSTGYLNSDVVCRKLSTDGIDRLYLNILAFRGYHESTEFVNLVSEGKLAVDDLNDRLTLRNNAISLGRRDLVVLQNPLAYHYYQWTVRPKLLNLQKYLKSNYDELIQH